MQNTLSPVDLPDLDLQAWIRAIQAKGEVPLAVAVGMIRQLTGVSIPSTSAELVVEPLLMSDGYSFRLAKMDDAGKTVLDERVITILDGSNQQFDIPRGSRIIVHLIWPLNNNLIKGAQQTRHLELSFSTEQKGKLLSGREYSWDEQTQDVFDAFFYDDQGRLIEDFKRPSEEKRDLVGDLRSIAGFQKVENPRRAEEI